MPLSPRNKIITLAFAAVLALLAAAITMGIFLLQENIAQRKAEATQHVFRVVDIPDTTVDPEIWGRNYPRQYDGYRRTVDTVRTRWGGSEAFDRLDLDPRLRAIFAGYAFGIDYREERGHAYMLSDQDMTERVKAAKQPGSCLHCHASVVPAYMQAGHAAGVPDDEHHREEALLEGFRRVNAMPYHEARPLVNHPVSCIDCHDSRTMQLKVTRPGFLLGIRELARSKDPVPNMPSIERWRKDPKGEYDPNSMATRQEMRSFVCGQCHVEYHFKGPDKQLTYPWRHGIKMDSMERYYDEEQFKDWSHQLTGAPVLKAQHPEFELWSQGVHARSGVACADCHMPYRREGAVKVSDHHIRSPLLNISNSCQVCHRYPESEIMARAVAIQDRTHQMMDRAEDALVAFIRDMERVMADSGKAGAVAQKDLVPIRNYHRKAQWRLDLVAAENSMGFHADQEAARILAEAIDYARQGQLELAKLQGVKVAEALRDSVRAPTGGRRPSSLREAQSGPNNSN